MNMYIPTKALEHLTVLFTPNQMLNGHSSVFLSPPHMARKKKHRSRGQLMGLSDCGCHNLPAAKANIDQFWG